MNQEKCKLLKRIANHLILHSSFLDDIGLLHGKMGIVLFFAHYSRFTKDMLYDEFASDLLEDICRHIPENFPVNMEYGICGIGWGVEYLIRQGFIEEDSDEILSDLDKKVMERDLGRVSDMSFETGLKGISCYINQRIRSSHGRSTHTSFDERYISDWELVCDKGKISGKDEILYYIIDEFELTSEIDSWELGLNKGCAGFGVKLMLLNGYSEIC